MVELKQFKPKFNSNNIISMYPGKDINKLVTQEND